MTTLTAHRTAGRRERSTAPVLVAGAVLAASLVLHLRDPHRSGSDLC